MADSLDAILGFHQQALNLRAYRQQVLAANIANADTPNYQARDIDFNAALQQAQGASDTSSASASGVTSARLSLASTQAGHLAGSGGGADVPGNPALLYRSTLQMSADSNTVDMDVERSKFAENALHYEANVTFINGQLKTMLTAITG
jgi:flagellar basal-body rod protein FlgB